MRRTGFVLICLALFACKGKKDKEEGDNNGFSYQGFSSLFQKLTLPYQLTDTAFARNRDTTQIRSAEFATLIPDSLKTKWLGKGNKVQYVAIGRLPVGKDKDFYLVKAISGKRKLVLLLAFNNSKYGNVMPFLDPDNDGSTSQTSMIDGQFSIQKSITRRTPNSQLKEGREVYEYDAATNQFVLILINPIDNHPSLINPIDTFPKHQKLSGDYGKDKMNLVSIRDGKYPNQLMVYIHLDKNDGGCTGELKGMLLMTSSHTAIFRQGGDPCVLSFRFGSNSVTVKEDEGCGNHRGLDCLFNGSFQKKKEVKAKKSTKKK